MLFLPVLLTWYSEALVRRAKGKEKIAKHRLLKKKSIINNFVRQYDGKKIENYRK